MVLLRRDWDNSYILQKKFLGFITLTQQFDVPASYTYLTSLDEIIEVLLDNHKLSYCSYWTFIIKSDIDEFRPVVEFNDVVDLESKHPELFV